MSRRSWSLFGPWVTVVAVVASCVLVGPPAGGAEASSGDPAGPSAESGVGGTAATEEPGEAPAAAPDAVARSEGDAAAPSGGDEDELVDERTATTKTFTTDEPGVYRTEVYPEPVHFEADPGEWVEIDASIEPVADGFASDGTGAPVEVTTGEGTTDVAVELADDASVAFSLPSDTVAAAGADAVTVADVAEGVDAELEVIPHGVKETLLLADASAPRRYTFPLELEGVTASIAPGGAVDLTDGEGAVVGRIPAGWMADSSAHAVTGEPATTMAVTYSLVASTGGGTALQVDLDDAWLDDPARVYPVEVDPSVVQVQGGTDDTFVMAYSPGDRSALTQLQVGNNGYLGTRSFVHFGVGSVAGKTIHHAQLKLFQDATGSCTPTPMDIYRVGSAWTGPTVTQWGGPAPTGPVVATVTTGAGAAGCPAAWVTANVTSAVSAWASGSAANHGLTFRARDEAAAPAYKRFTSSDSANAPHVQVIWSEPATGGPAVPTHVAPTGQTGATPTLSATYSDPQGRSGSVGFLVVDDTGLAIGAGAGSTVASGSRSSWSVPAGTLTVGRTYTVAAFSTNNVGQSSANAASVSIQVAPSTCYSAGCEYDPATVSIPGDPALQQKLTECEGEPATRGFGRLAGGPPSGVTYTGTAGRDVVVVTSGPVRFEGLGGDDLVCLPATGFTSEAGSITVGGGDGNDRVVADANVSLTFTAGGGNDEALGGPAADTLNGGLGRDDLDGRAGIDTINGGDDADLLTGGDGADNVVGGPGHDRIVGGPGDDTLSGGGGDDTIVGDDGTDGCNGGSGGEVRGDSAVSCESVTFVEHQGLHVLSPGAGDTVFGSVAVAVEHGLANAEAVVVEVDGDEVGRFGGGATAGLVDLSGLTDGAIELDITVLDALGLTLTSATVTVELETFDIDDLGDELNDRYASSALSADEYLLAGTIAATVGAGDTSAWFRHLVRAWAPSSWNARQAVRSMSTAVATTPAPPEFQTNGDADCNNPHEVTWVLGLIKETWFCQFVVEPETFTASALPGPAADLVNVTWWAMPSLDDFEDADADGLPDVLADATVVIWKAQLLYEEKGFSMAAAHDPTRLDRALNVFAVDAASLPTSGMLNPYEKGFSSPYSELLLVNRLPRPMGHPIRIDASDPHWRRELTHEFFHTFEWNYIGWLTNIVGVPWLPSSADKTEEIVSFYESAANWATQEYSAGVGPPGGPWGYNAGHVRDEWLADPTRRFLSGGGNPVVPSDPAYAWFPALEWLDEHGGPSTSTPGDGSAFLARTFRRFSEGFVEVGPVDLIEDQLDQGQWGPAAQGGGFAAAWPRMWAALYMLEDAATTGTTLGVNDRPWAAFWDSEPGAWRGALDYDDPADPADDDTATDDDAFGHARPGQVSGPAVLDANQPYQWDDTFDVHSGGAAFQDFFLPTGSQGTVDFFIDALDRSDKYAVVTMLWKQPPPTDPKELEPCVGIDGEPMIWVSDGQHGDSSSLSLQVPLREDCRKVTIGIVHIDPNSTAPADDFRLRAGTGSVEPTPPPIPGPTGPKPANTSAPVIEKATLPDGRPTMRIVSTGTWVNDPGTFTYQWEACNASGTGCAAIDAEWSPCFPSRHARIGSMIRLALHGIGEGGRSTLAATSNLLPVVAADFAALPVPNAPWFFEETGSPDLPGRALASRDGSGNQIASRSWESILSDHGRVVSNGDGLWDVETQTYVGQPSGGGIDDLSATGRYIVGGHPTSPTLTDAGCGASQNLFVDPATGLPPSNRSSGEARISADGRFVVFRGSFIRFLTHDPVTSGFRSAVLRFDRFSGELTFVSAIDGHLPASGSSAAPDISDDGERVAYWTSSPQLGSGPEHTANGNVVVTHIPTGGSRTTKVVSKDIPGRVWDTVVGFHPSFCCASIDITGDGELVSFVARERFYDALSDIQSFEGRIYRVSSSGEDLQKVNWDTSANRAVYSSMSSDGRWVAYTAFTGGSSCRSRVVEVGTTNMVEVTDHAGELTCVTSPQVSDDGRIVSYTTSDTSRLLHDVNGDLPDLWVEERGG